MNLTLSPPVKILALVLVLAGVAFAASLSLLGKSSTTVPASERHGSAARRTTTHTTPAASTPAKSSKPAKPAATKPHVTAAKPVTKPVVKPRAKAKPVQRGNLVYSDLPRPLQWQLSQHKVVVVSIYDPQAGADAISVAEAHAGAVDAGAGFLLVSVLDNKVAGVLTALLPGGGLLPDPGVLVYRAPGTIALRIDGFADRASIAQAAMNALAGYTGPAPSTPATAASATAAPATVTP